MQTWNLLQLQNYELFVEMSFRDNKKLLMIKMMKTIKKDYFCK